MTISHTAQVIWVGAPDEKQKSVKNPVFGEHGILLCRPWICDPSNCHISRE